MKRRRTLADIRKSRSARFEMAGETKMTFPDGTILRGRKVIARGADVITDAAGHFLRWRWQDSSIGEDN